MSDLQSFHSYLQENSPSSRFSFLTHLPTTNYNVPIFCRDDSPSFNILYLRPFTCHCTMLHHATPWTLRMTPVNTENHEIIKTPTIFQDHITIRCYLKFDKEIQVERISLLCLRGLCDKECWPGMHSWWLRSLLPQVLYFILGSLYNS